MDEEQFCRKLIDLVSTRSFLYNPHHPEKKLKLKHENAWKEIASSLNSTAAVCKSKWANLRTTYTRKHKTNSNQPSGSGVRPSEQWPFFSQPSFLECHIKHRRSSDNLNFSGELVVEKELLPRSAEDLDPEPSFADDFSTEIETTSISPSVSEPEKPTTSISPPVSEPEKPSSFACRKRKRSDDQKHLKNELLNFLKKKDEELNALNITRDRFDDFGAFVASELRNKDPTEVSAFMQQICAVLYSRIDYA